ncbi:unnamed protein product [Peniophora sp. CBMAI 1063]|nr:unnamed protein product [Peniophora sp. CBMAI 1063]
MAASNATVDRLNGIAGDVKAIADYHVFPLVLESVLYAFFTVLMAYYSIQYWRDTRRVRGIFALSVCLYAACTLMWALDIRLLWLELYHFIPDALSPDPSRSKTLADFDSKSVAANLLFLHGITESVIFNLSDWVSLWRAYIVYGRPRWIKITCFALIFLSSVGYLLLIVLLSTIHLQPPPAFVVNFRSSLHGKAPIALTTLSLSTTTLAQIFATGLMARKAWLHRRAIRQLSGTRQSSPGRLSLVTVLYIVIETGVMYTLLWIVCLLVHDRVMGERGYQWSTYWMCQIAGIYPTLIVVVVSLKVSILERSTVDSAAALDDGPLSFATTRHDAPDAIHVKLDQLSL